MNKIVLAALSAAIFSNANAQVFSDDFQAYSNDAELQAVWTRTIGTPTSIYLSNNPNNPADNSVGEGVEGGRLTHTLDPIPTAGNTISFSFDFFDFYGGSHSGRSYGEIRQSGSANGLLAAGIYNAIDTGTYAQNRYQARSLDDGGWIQLDAPRSQGWHNFKFEISGNQVNLFVDGVLDPQFTGRALNSFDYEYDTINLGFGGGGNTPTQFDNIDLAVVPEPGTYALVFGALTFAGAAVRRRLVKKC